MTDVIASARSLSEILTDYEPVDVTPEHVMRWVEQFPVRSRPAVMRALVRVFRRTYFSRERVISLSATLAAQSLDPTRGPTEFWSRTSVLRLGAPGHSQDKLGGLLSRFVGVPSALAPSASSIGDVADFVLFDDFLLSGACLIEDLGGWIAEHSPKRARVYVALLAAHATGLARANFELRRITVRAAKDVTLTWWCSCFVDDADVSDVLRDEFLTAGRRIVAAIDEPSFWVRPLGYSGRSEVGFGALVASYRTCPNHAPLALWFGDASRASACPWNTWYPLLQRPLPVQRRELHRLRKRYFAYPPDIDRIPVPATRRFGVAVA